MRDIIIALIACNGFWSLLTLFINRRQAKKDKKEAEQSIERKALLGLLHDRVYNMANDYIKVGCISDDQYDNLQYLYKPYKDMGGNGTCERLMKEIERLPISKGE